MEIQGIIKDYFENLYSSELENLEEKEKFLDKHDHPKLNQQCVNYLSTCIMHKKIEATIKSLPKNKNPRPDGFKTEFYQTIKEKLIPTLLKLFY
jgi:hypothetical protein